MIIFFSLHVCDRYATIKRIFFFLNIIFNYKGRTIYHLHNFQYLYLLLQGKGLPTKY